MRGKLHAVSRKHQAASSWSYEVNFRECSIVLKLELTPHTLTNDQKI